MEITPYVCFVRCARRARYACVQAARAAAGNAPLQCALYAMHAIYALPLCVQTASTQPARENLFTLCPRCRMCLLFALCVRRLLAFTVDKSIFAHSDRYMICTLCTLCTLCRLWCVCRLQASQTAEVPLHTVTTWKASIMTHRSEQTPALMICSRWYGQPTAKPKYHTHTLIPGTYQR